MVSSNMASTTGDGSTGDDQAADPRLNRVAVVYAQALLGATESAGTTAEVLDELDSLVTEVLDRQAKFEAILASRVISPDEKLQIVERVCSGRASPLLLSFLRTLARHDRLNLLRAVRRSARDQLDVLRGRVRVDVTTATPLEPGVAAQLVASLRRLLSSEPQLVPQVDPELIGGLLLRVGDKVFDGTVATQLARARRQMIQRSVHEIQSRRDSFRNPAGD